METKTQMNLLASQLGRVAEELDEFRRDYLLAKAEHERNVAIFKNKLQATEKIPQHRLESLTTENLELYEEYLKLINLSCKLEDAKNRFEVIIQQLNAKKAEYKIEGNIL